MLEGNLMYYLAFGFGGFLLGSFFVALIWWFDNHILSRYREFLYWEEEQRHKGESL